MKALPMLIDDPEYYRDKVLSQEDILKWFDIYESGWVHDGNIKSPHVELSGGKCSGGYFNCRKLFSRNPLLCEIFAGQLVRVLEESKIDKPDWVVGSSYSAITISYEVAKKLNVSHEFTEKDPKDPKKQIWKDNIPKEAKVLQIEELITTLETTIKVRRAVEQSNLEPVEFLPIVGTVIHRPAKLPIVYDEIQVLPLVEIEVWAVEQKDCPLCAVGSPRYKPKANWAKLTGKA